MSLLRSLHISCRGKCFLCSRLVPVTGLIMVTGQILKVRSTFAGSFVTIQKLGAYGTKRLCISTMVQRWFLMNQKIGCGFCSFIVLLRSHPHTIITSSMILGAFLTASYSFKLGPWWYRFLCFPAGLYMNGFLPWVDAQSWRSHPLFRIISTLWKFTKVLLPITW